MKKQKPLSPHLSIYRIQITSLLSILHRGTGVALFVGLVLIMWWIVYIVYCPFEHQLWMWEMMSSATAKAIIIIWSYSLFYHFFNGIRHLFWDFGMGYDINTLSKSGIAVIITSLATCALCWFIAIYFGSNI